MFTPKKKTTTTKPSTTITSKGQSLIGELYDLLEREKDPKNTVVLELILDQWQEAGDKQMAFGVAEEILKRDPSHAKAKAYLRTVQAARPSSSSQPATLSVPKFSLRKTTTKAQAGRPEAGVARNKSGSSTGSSTGSSGLSTTLGRLASGASSSASSVSGTTKAQNRRPITVGPAPRTETDRSDLEKELAAAFADLQTQAATLEQEMLVLQSVGLVDNATILQDTSNIKSGHVCSVVMPPVPPPVRQLVRELLAAQRGGSTRQQCLELVVHDFTEVAEWALQDEDAAGKRAVDVVQDRLKRRQVLLDAMLPNSHERGDGSASGGDSDSDKENSKNNNKKNKDEDDGQSLEGLGYTAMMLVTHALLVPLGKTYANAETMVMAEPVASIPAERLLVTADNYVWDMEELAEALAGGSGVMRNPLTRDMFGADDVRQILRHPLGRPLRPLRLAQDKLRRGVRPDTIDRMQKLSATMLEDQTAHATPTLEAIDLFLAYALTLPLSEQRTLGSLKVPARDSHTGQAYDSSILEAVKDAKGNRVCFHKAGDFLGQAATYLLNCV